MAALIKNFYDEALGEFGIKFELDVVLRTLEEYKRNVFLLIINDKAEGILAGKEVKTPISDERLWHELIWYVNKSYRKGGVLLLRQVQRILKDEGYNEMIMVLMANSKADKLARFYERLGFREMEKHYIGGL